MTALRALERFAAGTRRARAREGERCELCAAPIAEPHRHLVDRDQRQIACTCVPCALLFPDTTSGRYKAIPTRGRRDATWVMTADDLALLGVPVGLAFFFQDGKTARWTAVFPSPAGSTEAELPDGAWTTFAADKPLVRSIAGDVEALLVHRKRSGETTCLVAPIDRCFALTGVLRSTWRGIDGGDDCRAAVDAFIARLSTEALLS